MRPKVGGAKHEGALWRPGGVICHYCARAMPVHMLYAQSDASLFAAPRSRAHMRATSSFVSPNNIDRSCERVASGNNILSHLSYECQGTSGHLQATFSWCSFRATVRAVAALMVGLVTG